MILLLPKDLFVTYGGYAFLIKRCLCGEKDFKFVMLDKRGGAFSRLIPNFTEIPFLTCDSTYQKSTNSFVIEEPSTPNNSVIEKFTKNKLSTS